MLVAPVVLDGNLSRTLLLGDLLSSMEGLPQASATVGVSTLTAAQVCTLLLKRSGVTGGAFADTLPSANAWVNQLRGNINTLLNPVAGYGPVRTPGPMQWPSNQNPIWPGLSYRFCLVNVDTTQTITLTAPASAGVAISGTATVATATWREWLVQILNSSPAYGLSVTTLNGSKVLSNVDVNLIANIVPGMSIYGAGIGASAKVAAVNLDAGTITTDVNSSASADLIAASFTPTILLTNLRAGTV